MHIILFIAAGLATALILLPLLMEMIARAGFVRPNYSGRNIPAAVGLLFFLVPLFVLSVTYLVADLEAQRTHLLVFLFVAGAMAILGLADDVFGSRRASGLKGHFMELLRGRLTTGALKALGGLTVAFLAALTTAELRHIILNTLIIALAANMLNLLDLRPGRAVKGFLPAAGLLFAAAWADPRLIFVAVLTGAVFVYAPADLKARAMMGDSGSNVLGAALGLTAVWVLALPAKVGVLVFLVGMHLLAERYSFTEIIARNRILEFFDRLGRNREEFTGK